MKKIAVIVLALLFLCGITVAGFEWVAQPKSDDTEYAADVHVQIAAELQKMNVFDAELWEDEFVQSSYREVGLDVLFYYSDSTGMRYAFNAQSGKLISFVKIHDSGPSSTGTDVQTTSKPMPLTDEERRIAALAYAEKDLADAIIGELRIHRENSGGSGDSNYTILEYYNSIPTGTNAFIVIDEYGQTVMYSSGIGNIFSRDVDGSIVMVDDTPLIAESAAIKNALTAVQADAEKRGLTGVAEIEMCNLLASGSTLYYDMQVLFDQETAYDYSYKVSVEAQTGEVRNLLKSA